MGALFGSSLSWILHLTTWYTSIAAQKITHKWFFWSEFSAKYRSVPNFSMKRKKRLIKAIVVEVTVAPDIYLNKNRLNRPFLCLQYEIKFVVNFNHESSNIVHGFHFFLWECHCVRGGWECLCVCGVVSFMGTDHEQDRRNWIINQNLYIHVAKAARTPKAFAEEERGREREGDSERNDEAS